MPVTIFPAFPGVGEKTAKKFLEEFGSLEALLENTDKLKGKMKEKVEENAELGRLSKQLATICITCDVTFDAKDYELSMPDSEKVQEIFEELEFRRLREQFIKLFSSEPQDTPTQVTSTETAKKEVQAAGSGQFSLFGQDGSAPATLEVHTGRKTIKDVPHVYQSIQAGMALELFLKKLMKQTAVCFDTETTSLNPLEAELVGIAFSWEAGKGYYLPFPDDQDETLALLEKLGLSFRLLILKK